MNNIMTDILDDPNMLNIFPENRDNYEIDKLDYDTMVALANSLDCIAMSEDRKGSKSGIVVKEISSERIGICYHSEQTIEFVKLNKFLVHWNDKKEPTLKAANKLTQIGFVD